MFNANLSACEKTSMYKSFKKSYGTNLFCIKFLYFIRTIIDYMDYITCVPCWNGTLK